VRHDDQAVVTRPCYREHFAAYGRHFRPGGAIGEGAVEAPPGLEVVADPDRKQADTGPVARPI
jgi:hypothetical protein